MGAAAMGAVEGAVEEVAMTIAAMDIVAAHRVTLTLTVKDPSGVKNKQHSHSAIPFVGAVMEKRIMDNLAIV
jgi:hypothetical protein